MPQSSNRRRGRRGQKRKGSPQTDQNAAEPAPRAAPPVPEYTVEEPYDPDVPVGRQIAQQTLRSVTFEMTARTHRELGLDRGNFIRTEGLQGPHIVNLLIDPLADIRGHPRWQTGEDVILELDQHPEVHRDEFPEEE